MSILKKTFFSGYVLVRVKNVRDVGIFVNYIYILNEWSLVDNDQ